MKTTIVGSSGKMGKELVKALTEREFTLRLHACVVRQGNAGIDNVKILSKIPVNSEVVIDFSSKEAVLDNAGFCHTHKIPYVCGVTGLNSKQLEQLESYAVDSLMLYSRNMSIQVNILANLVEQAAKVLGSDFDIEIIEMHHNQKIDVPSGTALMLGEAAARGRKVDFAKHMACNRIGKRKIGDIGFASLRGGDIVGEHKVIFAGKGERLELSHIDNNRAVFAYGALRAAEWLVRQQPGKLYSICDIIS